MDYQRRQELGQARRAEYLRRLDHAQTLARVYWGMSLGAGFVFFMGIVAGVDTLEKGIVLIVSACVLWGASAMAGHTVHKVKRARRY